MSAIKGFFYCGNCRTHFYTDDGLSRHYCPGTDFETHPIGTLKKLGRLERENNRLRQALKSIKIIASDMEDPERRLGPGWHDERPIDGGSD